MEDTMKFINGEWVADENSPEQQSLKNIANRKSKITQPSPSTPKPKKSPKSIREQNMQNPLFAYAYKLADHLTQQLENKTFRGLIFRNLKNRCHYDPTTKKITMDYQMVEYCAREGYYESYKSVQWVWGNNGYRNYVHDFEAIWMIVLHEYAHHIQIDRNLGYKVASNKGGYHHNGFQTILNELIILFPFSEVENL